MSDDESKVLVPASVECYYCHATVTYKYASKDEQNHIYMHQEILMDSKTCPSTLSPCGWRTDCAEYICLTCRGKGLTRCLSCKEELDDYKEVNQIEREIIRRRCEYTDNQFQALANTIKALQKLDYCSSCHKWDALGEKECRFCKQERFDYREQCRLRADIYNLKDYSDKTILAHKASIKTIKERMFERFCARRKAYHAKQPRWTFQCYVCDGYVSYDKISNVLGIDEPVKVVEPGESRCMPLSETNLDENEKLLRRVLNLEYVGDIVCCRCKRVEDETSNQ